MTYEERAIRRAKTSRTVGLTRMVLERITIVPRHADVGSYANIGTTTTTTTTITAF